MPRKPKATGADAAPTTTTSKDRAPISRERRLALALRAILELEGANPQTPAHQDADALLNELGYTDLQSIPKRLAAIEAQLNAALAAGDGALISKLGLELQRVKSGRGGTVDHSGTQS